MPILIYRLDPLYNRITGIYIFKFPAFSQFFPVQPQIFPVPIYIICDYYIHKADLADLSSFALLKFCSSCKFPDPKGKGYCNICRKNSIFSPQSFGKMSKFPVFSLTGNIFGHFPVFPVPWVPCIIRDMSYIPSLPSVPGANLQVRYTLTAHVRSLCGGKTCLESVSCVTSLSRHTSGGPLCCYGDRLLCIYSMLYIPVPGQCKPHPWCKATMEVV